MSKTTLTISEPKIEKNTATVAVTIPQSRVTSEKPEVIKHLGSDVVVKGFRKGKAPTHLIEEKLSKGEITSHTLEHLLPEILAEVLKKNKVELLGNPVLKKASTPDNSDWEIELDLPLIPEFKLGDYKKKVSAALKGSEIWTPEKGDPKEKPDANKEREDKLQKLFDTLLKTFKLDLPESVINAEVNQSLTRLLNQLEQLNIALEDYLQSLGKSQEELKNDYEKSASENISLEVILSKIAHDLEIKVSDSEVDGMINASGSEQAKAQLNEPSQRNYVRHLLVKQKTIDELLKL